MSEIQVPLLHELAEKLKPMTKKDGDISKLSVDNLPIVMNKGDEADCMYILYSGKVGIFVDNECTIKVAEVVPNQVFGEKALESNNKRGASVKALMECKLLCL